MRTSREQLWLIHADDGDGTLRHFKTQRNITWMHTISPCTPQTMPPLIWLLAVLGLRMRLALYKPMTR